MDTIDPRGMAKGLGSIDAVFGLIFKMADVTRFDSTRFVNYKNGVFNSLNGWLPWQCAYFEDYCFEVIRHVSLRCYDRNKTYFVIKRSKADKEYIKNENDLHESHCSKTIVS